MSLFNKVGDLYIKLSQVPEAVEMYERAATLYADSGFPNNAIALCNKVLRNAPGRTHIYLKLAMLMVERGFVPEAKQNLLEYADRMQKSGKTDEAFRALKEFADLSPENEEIRLLLAEQLKLAARTAEAREQLAKLFHEAQASGDARRSRRTLQQIRAIDPDFDPATSPKPKVKERKQKSSELVFLDVDEDHRGDAPAPTAPPPVASVDEVVAEEDESTDFTGGELEIQRTTLGEEDRGAPAIEALEGLEVQREFEAEGDEPRGSAGLEIERTTLDAGAADDEAGIGTAPARIPGDEADESLDFEIETEPFGDAAAIEVPELDLTGFDVADDGAPTRGVVDEEAPSGVGALEAAVADDPDDPARHVALGEALLEAGARERGLEELDIALRLHEGREEWNRARGLADEILRLEPNSVRHHQKRVELAYRSGEKSRLVEAYLGLGDALVRTGGVERARLVYRRALEHEPDSRHAREALANLEPAPPPPSTPAPRPARPAPSAAGDYVDLGALILDESETGRDTRMRVQDEEPTGDEERDFQEMLAQFKRGIEANIEEEDWQAHYDLGVAFKEMGLLDEAIAEFQKALRSPAGRLRTAEALGGCFFAKGQYSVAGTVMRRAIETDASGDEAKIGLLYWLGRCEEEMKRSEEALAYYQRVFALDIRFQDVRERVKRLAGAGR